MPVTPIAPLLPPLKEPPVDVLVGEVLVDVPVTPVGDVVLLTVEPKPELEREGGPPEREVPVPVPVEDELVEEERAAAMSNVPVRESTVLTSPTGEAWKVYPEPIGTTGRSTVTDPSEVVRVFLKANVLRKMSLVR